MLKQVMDLEVALVSTLESRASKCFAAAVEW